MTLRGYGCLFLIALIIALVTIPAAAVVDSSVPVPLAAVGVPNLLQEKGKLQYTWEDFKADGDRAAENGNYEDSVKFYNKAEEMLVAADPSRSSTTDYSLGKLEQSKGMAYGNWEGHQAESDQAFHKSAELTETAKQKAKSEGSGCLIVTATFGSPLAGEVQMVRSFRDETVMKSYTGSRFMPGFNAWYYSFSPQVSMYINEHPVVKPAMQVLITPILQIVLFARACYTFLSFNPELATIAAITVGSTLYGLIYIFPTVMAGVWVARRRGWNGVPVRSLWPAVAVWVFLLVLIITGVALSEDVLTTVASGLFVIATIILTTGALSVSLSRYVGRKETPVQE